MKRTITLLVLILPSLVALLVSVASVRKPDASQQTLLVKKAHPSPIAPPEIEDHEIELANFYKNRAVQHLFDHDDRYSDWSLGLSVLAKKGYKPLEKAVLKLRNDRYPLERWHLAAESYLNLVPVSEIPDYMVDNIMECFCAVVEDAASPVPQDPRPFIFFLDSIGKLGPRADKLLPTLEDLKKHHREIIVEKALRTILQIKGSLR